MKHWGIWLKWGSGVVLGVLLIKALLVTSCFIPSSGMENSLYRGEGVLVNKWSYGLRLPFLSWFGYHRIGAEKVGKGDIVLFNNPAPANLETPIDRRELYISRCIGCPGDTLMLDENLLSVGEDVFSPDAKAFYTYPSSAEDSVLFLLKELDISGNTLAGYTEEGRYIRSFSRYEYYLITQRDGGRIGFRLLNGGSACDARPFVVPGKSLTVSVNPWNINLLCHAIRNHEGRDAGVSGDTLFVEGRPVWAYTFTKDYYWMASNDPINLRDSRLFGFVPENHLIGKAWLIWFPSSKERFFQHIR